MLRRLRRRRRDRQIERAIDEDLASVRHQMARDAQGALGRWRELDRLDAEIECKRMELEELEALEALLRNAREEA